MVYKHHREGEDVRTTPMFQILTGCYKMLLEDLKRRSTTPTQQPQPIHRQHGTQTSVSQPQRFTLAKFNELFDQHKVSDFTHAGYNDWMSNPDSFKSKDMRTQLSKYKEPQPINLAHGLVRKTGTDFYELGVDKVDDFSAENVNQRELNFMDYRVAHTAQHIVDPNEVKMRREYRSIQELEADRASPLEMNSSEREEYLRRQKMEKYLEEKRLKKLDRYDEKGASHYTRTQNLFLPPRD